MANKPINMLKIRQIIKFSLLGHGNKAISKLTITSKNTVKLYLRRFRELGIPWDELEHHDDQTLYNIFTTQHSVEKITTDKRFERLEPLLPTIAKALRKKGMTIEQQWRLYKQQDPGGYQSTQFYFYVMEHLKNRDSTMHIEHKAGDKVFVDFCGDKLYIVNPDTGELIQMEVFVGILGCSQLTFVCAVPSQKTEDMIDCCRKTFEYFQGVPQAVVTDNLKAAVIKSSKYEPKLNEAFETFCEHYGTTVIPTRAYKPKDKSLVEGAVKIVYQRIYSALADKVFTSIKDLNAAILELLEAYNNRPLKMGESRRQRFEQDEKHELIGLPDIAYELRESSICTVMKNGHINLSRDKHFYSVPYQHIGKKVKVLYNSSIVEIYYQYSRVAMHQRNYTPNRYTTNKDHLASKHKYLTEWNPDFFIQQGKAISDPVALYLEKVMESKRHPEQGYKACSGILSLGKRVGNERLTNACIRAMEFETYNYYSVVDVLEKGLDKFNVQQDLFESNTQGPSHQNIRGKSYYK